MFKLLIDLIVTMNSDPFLDHVPHPRVS